MIQILLLYILFAPVFGLEGQCLKQNFMDISRESCNFNYYTRVENIWRGELVYEELEGGSGIRVNWKLLVQKPHCVAGLKFFVNDRLSKTVHLVKNNSDWIELAESNDFNLKVQVLYRKSFDHKEVFIREYNCTEATKTVTVKKDETTRINSGNPDEDASNSGFYIFLGLASIPVTFTLIGFVYMSWQHCPRTCKCCTCTCCKDLEKRDVNDIYGTYARGWDGEGEYGDGDKVYVSNSNPEYQSYDYVETDLDNRIRDQNSLYGGN